MRNYVLFIMSLWLIPIALKANELSFLTPSAAVAASAHETESTTASINNISAIMVGCELDRKCMQAMLEEIAQNNANALYQNLLLVLASQQAQIEEEASACQVDETKILRKEAARCISEIMAKVNTNADSGGAKGELNACIQYKMEEWAKKGNLFAQGLLANRANKLGDTNAKLYWERLIQNQAGTPAYETFAKCFRSFQLIPPGISEVTFQSLQKGKDTRQGS